MWQRLKIVFSGHEVPGEGEHKIMGYIRSMKMQPDYNPMTKHCMCGQDADLIMLALATHEPHFSLLREHIDFQSFARVRSSEALVWVCLWAFVVLTRSGSRAQGRNSTKTKTKATQEVKWQLLHIGILREYLAADLRPNVPYPAFDAERAIDDFVLMTFLCGNDFIPHLPSMDIGESALNTLFLTYRDLLPKIGYLSEKGVVCHTCCCCACARAWIGHAHSVYVGQVNTARMEVLLRVLGSMEEEVFANREREAEKYARRCVLCRRLAYAVAGA